MQTYTTKQGDMWDSIAHQQLGGTSHTGRLMRVNPEYVGYYIFPAGLTLALPDVSPPPSSSLPPWKRVKG